MDDPLLSEMNYPVTFYHHRHGGLFRGSGLGFGNGRGQGGLGALTNLAFGLALGGGRYGGGFGNGYGYGNGFYGK